MPSPGGMLSDEEQNQAIAFLEKVWTQGRTCPIDGTDDWVLQDVLVHIPSFRPKGLVVGGKSLAFPLVVVVCKTCGYVMTFSAVRLGLVKEKDVIVAREASDG